MIDITAIRERYAALSQHLDERARRIFAATEAKTSGYGGIAAMVRATGIAASTIGRGLKELAAAEPLDPGHPSSRRRWQEASGGGYHAGHRSAGTGRAGRARRSDVAAALDLQEPVAVDAGLGCQGHRVGRTLVGELLHQQKFSLQANRKTREGESHPDRDAQFTHLNESVPSRTGRRRAGDLGRHQEERACRRLQECRPRMASSGRTRSGPGA